MIELRVLGALHLRREDGVEVRSVVSQPRRVALLAYLALRSGSGPVRRDTLLGLFWPESETGLARGALRNALHFLRRSLGAGAIESLGGEELRVPSGALRCDAVEFDRLVGEGLLREALELYRGDLLEGFFISGSPAFEHWLDAERRRLLEAAVRVALTLADREEEEGRLALAAQHARRAVSLAPGDELPVRRLMELLVRSGDRVSARRVYADWERRIAGLEVAPSPHTQKIVAMLAATGESQPGEPAPGGSPAGSEGSGGLVTSTGDSDARSAPEHPVSLRNRRIPAGGLARAAVAAGLFLLVGAGVFRASRIPSAEPSPDRLAVFPFDFRGQPAFSFLGEGLVDLLSSDLDGAGAIRAVDPRNVFVELGGRHGPSDPSQAAQVAAKLGAGLFVLGEAVETDGQLRLRATVYETVGDRPHRRASAEVEGASAALFATAEQLASELLTGWLGAGSGVGAWGAPGRNPVPERRGYRATASVEALKAYLRGEREYRAGRYERSVDALRRAVAEDPEFVMAHYRLSTACIWVGRNELARSAARRAYELSGRLPPEDSLLVEAWYRARTGEPDVALRLYERLTRLRPDYGEVWWELGELQFHWGPSFGTPSSASRRAFDRVLADDAGHVGALLHLARLAAQAGDRAGLDSLVERALAGEPAGAWALEMEALRAVASDDDVRRVRVLRAVGLADERSTRNSLMSLAAFGQDLKAAAVVAAGLEYPGRSESARTYGRLMSAELEAAHGRRGAAAALLARSGLSPARILEFQAALATLPFFSVPDSELVRIRRGLAALREPPVPDAADPVRFGEGTFPPLVWEGVLEARRLYLVGALSARLGEFGRVEEVSRVLDGMGGEEGPLGPYLARLLRARIAFLRGDARAARAILGPPTRPPTGTYETLADYPRGYERYLRAEVAAALGSVEEAVRWYETFPTPNAANLPYLAPAVLRRARIHAERGDAGEARRLYGLFLALWGEAEPDLRDQVEAARGALAGF